jgi:hypothetical protein
MKRSGMPRSRHWGLSKTEQASDHQSWALGCQMGPHERGQTGTETEVAGLEGSPGTQMIRVRHAPSQGLYCRA